jgi:tRNA:m4X modification enzyme
VIGSLYCGNHLPTGEQVASNKAKKFKKECRERVPCPIDPRHTCYKYDLEKHILICNKRKDAETMKKLPFYSDNINSGRYILPMSCMEEVESRSDTKTKEDADHQEALSKTQELKFIEKLVSVFTRRYVRYKN